jgi:transmembrane sensor
MTDIPNSPRNQLAEEAAEWFARMRGPDAESDREAFERWLARGALHRAAYNRVAEIFALGKALKQEPEPMRVSGLDRRWPALLVAVVIAVALALAWRSARDQISPQSSQGRITLARGVINSPVGAIRRLRLSDGSVVTLDSGSELAFALDGAKRDLRLLRGRARFEVAHDGRPFLVHAGAGAIIARGTIFDVSLRNGREVMVRLLQGKVDVRLDRPGGDAAMRVRHLDPGGAVSFGTMFAPDAKDRAEPAREWPLGFFEAKATRLAEILAEANRYGGPELIAASEKIADLRVTGRFTVNDGPKLARQLATVFNLRLDFRETGRIILEEADPDKKIGDLD